MGREVRRVPADWQHPVDATGALIPMRQYFPYNADEILEGIIEGWLKNEPPHYGMDVMPDWPEAERTHWQMYEDTTEGTPISPALESPEALAQWLVEHQASAFGDLTATYEQWLGTIQRGYAPSMVMRDGVVRSGVEGFLEQA